MKKALSIAIVAAISVTMTGCVTSTVKKDEADPSAEAAKYHTKVGLIHIERGELVEAKKPLSKALNAFPGYPDAHAAFGLLYQIEKEYEEANRHYYKAVKNAPENSRIRNNFGSFLYSQGSFKKACDQFQQASEDKLYEKRANAFVNLGRCLNQVGQDIKAIEMFEKAIILNDRLPASYYELAQAQYKAGDLEKAIIMVDRFRAKNGRHTPSSLLLGLKVATEFGSKSKAKGYEITLKNIYPSTKENHLAVKYLAESKL